MIRAFLVSSCCLLWVACAAPAALPVDLVEGEGDTRGVAGLERRGGTGPFVAGAVERFAVHVDDAVVARLDWSASAGALTATGREAEWTLPAAGEATLSVRVHRRDGTTGEARWGFMVRPSGGPLTAQQALLATPMPVLDGGTLEVSGGACDVKYEGTTTNVAIAFTTATHPSLMYGRWNGSQWTLEVVDAMGFNVGGSIEQHVHLQVTATGVPHLVYVKDSQVWYATKVNNAWVRERADATLPLATSFENSSSEQRSAPTFVLNGSGQPVVLYPTGVAYSSTNRLRPAIAVRNGPGAWAAVSALPSTISASYAQIPTGELVLDGAGRFLFTIDAYDGATGVFQTHLAAWNGTSATSVNLNIGALRACPMDLALASPTRLLIRGPTGVVDVNLNATFASSTWTYSALEQNVSSFTGDIGWALTRPVVLHQHGSAVEIATPNASGFWTYAQHGSTSGTSASLAVHPTTGDVSICYQANNRIMFQ